MENSLEFNTSIVYVLDTVLIAENNIDVVPDLIDRAQ